MNLQKRLNEIDKAGEEFVKNNKSSFEDDTFSLGLGFQEGAKWADENRPEVFVKLSKEEIDEAFLNAKNTIIAREAWFIPEVVSILNTDCTIEDIRQFTNQFNNLLSAIKDLE